MTKRASVERNGDSVVILVTMKFKKRRGRKEIIVPEGLDGPAPEGSAAQEALVNALARAFHWQELIESGKYPSIAVLAEALGVDRSYVRRILVLATLAPGIVEAIAEGREPSGLSLERLGQRGCRWGGGSSEPLSGSWA